MEGMHQSININHTPKRRRQHNKQIPISLNIHRIDICTIHIHIHRIMESHISIDTFIYTRLRRFESINDLTRNRVIGTWYKTRYLPVNHYYLMSIIEHNMMSDCY
jgi:hypothetical protein